MAAAASAIERHPGWRKDVSEARLVGNKPPLWWVTRLFLSVAVIAVVMLIFNSVRQSLIDQGKVEGRQSAQAELSQLRLDLASAKGELRRKQLVLDAETTRKKELAVLYERAEAARKQAVADHAAALNRLKALEAQQQKPSRKK